MAETTEKQETSELLYVSPRASSPPLASPPPPKNEQSDEMFYLPPKIEGFTPTVDRGETLAQKAKRKCSANPFVPAGAAITAGEV